MYILKYVPSAEEGSVDVKKLISLYSSQFSYPKFQKANGKLTINNIPDASIGEIPVINILDASYSVNNFVLGYGKVEFDYLKQK
jgi:acetoacetate decarboxylase